MGPATALVFLLIGLAWSPAPDGVRCPECREKTTLVAAVSEFRYEHEPYIWDDCEHRRHVHSFAWTQTTYVCRNCFWSWSVIVDDPACPSCGWSRSEPVQYDPC
jgi:rubredoxin